MSNRHPVISKISSTNFIAASATMKSSSGNAIVISVMREMIQRLERQEAEPVVADRLCRGTLLSRQQYLHETNVEGYRDAREIETEGWSGDGAYPVRYPDRGRKDAHRRSR